MLHTSKPGRMQQTAIAQLVRELRSTMLLSRKTADASGLTVATIHRWKNERATPSPSALKQMYILLKQPGDQGEVLRTKEALPALEERRYAQHG